MELMETIDARNLACPEPVTRTEKALKKIKKGRLTVMVNSTESCQNVQRYAQSEGCLVKVNEKNGEFSIEIEKASDAATVKLKNVEIVILITGDQFGTGDEDLGKLLITTFINTLVDAQSRPSKMIFINRGVMLTTEGSRVLDTLQQLEREGVQIFSCGTCLNHYQMKEKLMVGQVGNMLDTANSLLSADKVMRI
jgi:selenium metabolism protein YedF